MQRSAGVPVTIIYAIQGLTVLFIAISLVVERQVGSPTTQVTSRVSASHQWALIIIQIFERLKGWK
jgi:simple sugar transport system permease protein